MRKLPPVVRIKVWYWKLELAAAGAWSRWRARRRQVAAELEQRAEREHVALLLEELGPVQKTPEKPISIH